MCTGEPKDVGELFLDKPDALVLAYDDIITGIDSWKPVHIGAATHTVIVTSKQAWLIIKPMKSVLDVKFYTDYPIDSDRIKKIDEYGTKFGHHIRIKDPIEVDHDLFRLLKEGYDYSMKD